MSQWRLRVWFQDASGSKSFTGAWMRSPNETAIFAFVEALRGLSDAQITHVDVSRRYPYTSQVPSGQDRGIAVLVHRAINPFDSSELDAFPMWVPEADVGFARDLWGYPIGARGFASHAGYFIEDPQYGDGEPVSLDNEYPDDSEDYYLIAIRRNFWHRLLRDARAYNTLSFTLPDAQARRVRLDIRDLFRGIPMYEILQRLDTIIQLLQEGSANTDEIEQFLLQIIAALGAP
jgi:hypothetical protein